MSEEPIIIEIDDSQLDAALLKMNLLGQTAKKTIGGRERELASALPRINREMRLILGRLPGMRQAIQLVFRARRLERGILLQKLGAGSTQFYLALIATTIILLQQMQRYRQQIERETKRYELMVRRARGWTHEEFVKGTKEWENYLRGMPP